MAEHRWADVEKHLRHWERYDLWDRTLYDLCSTHLGHHDRAAVVAKVYLIGRSYQTGLERHSSAEGKKGLDAVADVLCRNAKTIDRQIAPLRSLGDVPTRAALRRTCKAHLLLMNLAGRFTKRGQPRSFASKYLHFHAPITPIFDSIASTVISCRALSRWTAGVVPSSGRTLVDPHYWRFCHKVLTMIDCWKAAEVPYAPTARNVDKCLLGWGNWHAPKREA